MNLAVITGADGGMGMEITRAVATAGYQVIMACRDPQAAEPKRQLLMRETGNPRIETAPIDLASLASVAAFAEHLLKRGEPLALLMNNAGTMETERRITEDGLERTVSVNYVGPYLLTRKLLPLMGEGSRIVNMVSCTYAIGHLDFPDFFLRGRKGGFWRIPIYSNTKLALTLFTIDLASRVKHKGIVVNAADPGIVSTNIITMHMWFDPLTDILFRPFIRTPRKGAATAVGLLLDEDAGKRTGTLNASCRPKSLSEKYTRHVQMEELWERTESIVNMVSCTYAIGHLDFPDFFLRGRKGGFWRIPIYSNTKLALTLFTIDLASRVKHKGIVVNAADPGIVSTNIITMHMWFDPLTDILFRPFIRTPRKGAATAVGLLLDEDAGKRTGTLNASCRPKSLSEKYTRHVQMEELWERTESIVKKWL